MRHALRLPEVDIANLLIGPLLPFPVEPFARPLSTLLREREREREEKNLRRNKILVTRCATRNSLPSLFFQLWEEKISLSPRPRDPGVIASLRELNFKTRTRWWITWQAIFLMAILSSLRELCEKGRIKIVQGWAENKKSKSLMNRMTSDILLREFSKKKKNKNKRRN